MLVFPLNTSPWHTITSQKSETINTGAWEPRLLSPRALEPELHKKKSHRNEKPHPQRSPHPHKERKPACCSEDPVQPKNKFLKNVLKSDLQFLNTGAIIIITFGEENKN